MEEVAVIVDTFTVMNPTEFHATYLNLLTFDILQGMQEQVNSDLYVSPEGDNSNSGLNFAEPLKTIQYANSVILATEEEPHTIYLAEGIYSPSTNGEFFPVNPLDYVSNIGVDENTVILDAEGVSRVMTLSSKEGVIIANMTVTGGNAASGGGIGLSYASLTLQNVTVTNNFATEGGGINCRNNWENSGTQPKLINVKIVNNTSSSFGGGIYIYESNPLLENVTIANNSAQDGGGIYCRYFAVPVLVNTIMWNNSPQEIYYNDFDPYNTVTIAYSDIAGGLEAIATNNNGTVNWLEGNIDADPQFQNPGNGIYELLPNSPCIDAGIAYFAYAGQVIIDLEEGEYQGLAPDMGAYEYYDITGVQYGDINNDGGIDSYDAAQLLMYIVGLDPLPEDPAPWENWRQERADVDLNGSLQALDAAYILQYAVGMITEFPVLNRSEISQISVNLSHDAEYLYFGSEQNINSLHYKILNYQNVKAGIPEVLTANCIYYQNNEQLALAAAAGVSGSIIRIPYELIENAECSIQLEIEVNGCVEQLNYSFSGQVPVVTQINAIFPNPFNPETTIQYQLEEAGSVKLEAFNIKGQKVAVLLNEEQEVGEHAFTWDASGMNSGVYFIRLSCADYQKTHKVVLLK
jgi:predicted outer membrane repeat protein